MDHPGSDADGDSSFCKKRRSLLLTLNRRGLSSQAARPVFSNGEALNLKTNSKKDNADLLQLIKKKRKANGQIAELQIQTYE